MYSTTIVFMFVWMNQQNSKSTEQILMNEVSIRVLHDRDIGMKCKKNRQGPYKRMIKKDRYFYMELRLIKSCLRNIFQKRVFFSGLYGDYFTENIVIMIHCTRA